MCGSSTPTGAQTAERYKKYEVWTHQIPDGKVTEVCKSRL